MTNELIENIIKIINEEFKLKYPDYKGVYFFGSRARGDFNADSDYDIVLVFERDITRKFIDTLKYRIFDFEIENSIIIDTHIYNFQDIMDPITPFREEVKNKGIFYAA